MTDISDRYIENEVFPTEHFMAEDNPPHPDLWVDAKRVQIVEADSASVATYAVLSYVDNDTAMQLVPRRGNNERKRVIITVTGEDAALFTEPVDGATPVTIGTATFFPNGFVVPAGSTIEYESVAPLWVLSMGATTEYSVVSVLTESYYRDK